MSGKKKERILKISKYIISFFLLSIFFIFVHEISHLTISLAFGNTLEKIIFTNIIDDDIFSFGVALVVNRINLDATLWVSLAGSIGTIIVCVPFLILSIKRKSLFLCFIGSLTIFKEFIYWSYGTHYNVGDPYNFFWGLEYNHIAYDVNLFFLSLLAGTIGAIGLYILMLCKIWRLKEVEKYGK